MREAAQPRLDRNRDGAMADRARPARPSASRRGVWFAGFVIASLAAHAAVAGVLLLKREPPTPLPLVTVELDLRSPGAAGRTAPARRAAKPGLATRKAAAGRKIAERPRKAARPRPSRKKATPAAPKLVAAQRASADKNAHLKPSPAARAVARLHKAAASRAVVLRPAPPLQAPASKREVARFHKTLPSPSKQWRRKVRKPRHRVVRRRAPTKPARPAKTRTRETAARLSTGAPAGAVVPPRPAGGFGGNPTPHYPREARDNGWEGRVLLLVKVGADGRAAGVRVNRSSGHDVLDDSALRTVWRWRFRPGTRGGVPVASSVLIPIRFRLRR